MLAGLIRRLRRQRRDAARRPLIDLLRYCVGHAIRPLAGQVMTPELERTAQELAASGIADLADRGALAYFGIRDAADVGDAPVQLRVVVDEERGAAYVDLDLEALVPWVLAGGSRRRWMRPDELTAADLTRR